LLSGLVGGGAEVRVGLISLGEVLAVFFAQGADRRVGAFLADRAGLGRILVTRAVVEAVAEGVVWPCMVWSVRVDS
jgi:hypothetical protein